MDLPQTGGSYTRHPKTGELTPVTQPADAGFFTPIESEVDRGTGKETTISRKA
ncbi:hypothetical protein [Iodobacter fluviatilis]|uniref:hypothetical protein n=1 Tax=Iodobacter fluviatilis TaxID=537 RepID=UPI00165E4B48|nr:hypothetical protein [Iodobacter fluviatilis]